MLHHPAVVLAIVGLLCVAVVCAAYFLSVGLDEDSADAWDSALDEWMDRPVK